MRYVLASIWLALAAGASLAAEVKGLYRVEAVVQSRDDAARAQDLRRALEQVLRRVAPNTALNTAPVKAMLAKPEPYILEFEYASQIQNGQTVPVLQVDFDRERINDSLRRAGLEAWGPERPELLIWLALQDGQNLKALTAESQPELDHLLQELSATLSLPVVTPLWDLADQLTLSPADIAAGHAEHIRLGTTRYDTDTALTGRLSRAKGDTWIADWRLYRGENPPERWNSQAADFRAILDTGLTGAHARLAAQALPRDHSIASLELKVIGIASLDDANRVSAYLGKLSPVTQVEWLGVGAGEASFRVKVRGGRDALRQTVALGHRLRPATSDDPSTLTYELLP